jgi:chromosomal replication initiator protein
VSFRSYLPKTNSYRRVSLGEIDTVVSKRLGSTRGLGKSQPACFNRQIAMYLASHIGRWSTTTIGRFYGGGDHLTVVHGIQRIDRLRVADLEMEALLSEFERSLAGTKEPGTSETVSKPIGSNQVALRA